MNKSLKTGRFSWDISEGISEEILEEIPEALSKRILWNK